MTELGQGQWAIGIGVTIAFGAVTIAIAIANFLHGDRKDKNAKVAKVLTALKVGEFVGFVAGALFLLGLSNLHMHRLGSMLVGVSFLLTIACYLLDTSVSSPKGKSVSATLVLELVLKLVMASFVLTMGFIGLVVHMQSRQLDLMQNQVDISDRHRQILERLDLERVGRSPGTNSPVAPR